MSANANANKLNGAKPGGEAGNEQRRKVASVLVALGPERAAKLLKGMPPELVEDLAQETASIETLSPSEVKSVLTDFAQELVARRLMAEGGLPYTIDLLTRTLGAERAAELADRLDPERNRRFGYLADAAPELAAMVLAAEPSSLIALALAHLEPVQAAKILKALPSDKQADVAVRLAGLEHVHADVVGELDDDFRTRLVPLLNQPISAFEGVDLLVEVLHSSSQATEKAVLDRIRERDKDLADKVRDALFTFADIKRLDDRGVQEVLKVVDTRDLAVALKEAEDDVAERIFRNLSERARENLQDEIEFLRGIRKRDIIEAQKRIIEVIRSLESSGSLTIERESGDDE
ncbi:MAG: flagellar motor switch protein FliG [Acidimicrobiia bacterium]